MVIPLLLITFNRPEHTKKTIEALRAQRPPLVYVFQDGPRNGNEKDELNCKAVQEVVNREIDWECELHAYSSEKNRGCRDAIIYAINCVFKEYESVIVVEDDVVTSPAFYTYMCRALEFYRKYPAVWSISGYSLSPSKFKVPEDYDYDVFASPRLLNWGWGTWRNRWEKTDWTMSYYAEFMNHPYERQVFSQTGCDMIDMLREEYEGRSSAWDIQFAFAHFANHAISIVPCISYTYNIGFDGSGTHCGNTHQSTDMNTYTLNTNIHPKLLENLYCDPRIINAIYTCCSPHKTTSFKKIMCKLFRKFKKLPMFS